MMRICYLADATSIHTQRWVRYFMNKGHEIHIISEWAVREGKIGKCKLHVLKKLQVNVPVIFFPIKLLLFFIQIKRIINRIKPDILHAHYVTDYGFWSVLTGFHPLIVTSWGSDILLDPKRSILHKSLVKYTLKKADLITTDGENTTEEMINLGAAPDKIRLILHGVDTEEFSPTQKSGAIKEKLKVSNFPVVITNRSLIPRCNVETVIKSVPLVLKQFSETKFIIAGDGVEKDYLKDMARSLGVSDSIRFIGQIPHDELPYYLTLADVYIFTSLSEGGISVSLAEAMSCGLPPVVTNVGDNERWIEDGKNGFIIPTNRADLLADKIIFLLGHKELRDKMGEANRRLIEQRADYKKEMDKMGELYKKLVTKKGDTR